MRVIERGSRKPSVVCCACRAPPPPLRRLCLNSMLVAVKLAMSTEMHDNML